MVLESINDDIGQLISSFIYKGQPPPLPISIHMMHVQPFESFIEFRLFDTHTCCGHWSCRIIFVECDYNYVLISCEQL